MRHLVAVGLGLVRAFLLDANVLGLLIRELCELSTKAVKVEPEMVNGGRQQVASIKLLGALLRTLRDSTT